MFGYFPYSEYEPVGQGSSVQDGLGEGWRAGRFVSNHLVFNLKSPIFRNAEVRRAIAHALDKKLIVSKSAAGLGRVAIAHTPMGLPWSNPNAPQYNYDPTKAQSILNGAGYPAGPNGIRFRARLIWNNSDSEHAKAAEVIAQLLKAVRIEVQLIPMDPGSGWRRRSSSGISI